jgi:hypothetical protein
MHKSSKSFQQWNCSRYIWCCVIIFVVLCIYCCVHLLCQNVLRMLVASIHFTTLSPLWIICNLSYYLYSGDYIHVCVYVCAHVHKCLWVCACVHMCTPCTCSCLYNRPTREHPEMLESAVSSYNVTTVIQFTDAVQIRSPIPFCNYVSNFELLYLSVIHTWKF